MHYITSLTKIPPIFNQKLTPFLYILSMKICSVYMCFSSRFSTTICSGKNAVARCRRKTFFCKIYNYAVACRPFTTLHCLASLFVFNSVQDTKPRLRNLTHYAHPLYSPNIFTYYIRRYIHSLNSPGIPASYSRSSDPYPVPPDVPEPRCVDKVRRQESATWKRKVGNADLDFEETQTNKGVEDAQRKSALKNPLVKRHKPTGIENAL